MKSFFCSSLARGILILNSLLHAGTTIADRQRKREGNDKKMLCSVKHKIERHTLL